MNDSDSQDGYENVLQTLRMEAIDDRDLPFVQLGDLFFHSTDSIAFAVVNASCDLQFVPEHVWKARKVKERDARTRDRLDSILLVPGSFREPTQSPRSQLTTGLLRIDSEWKAVDWFPNQMISIPHGAIRRVLQDRGYRHESRLQMSRAIELQQACFAQHSRVGLEVQPPLHREVAIKLFANINGDLFPIGEDSKIEAIAFHSRQSRVAVIKYDSLSLLRKVVLETSEVAAAHDGIKTRFFKLHKLPIVVPDKIVVTDSTRSNITKLKVLEDNVTSEVQQFGVSLGEPTHRDKLKKISVVLSISEK
ncbi:MULTISPECIES: hypothetical protein [Gimesia]|nr:MULTISPECIES: hypothetical protein [Gimesia]